MSSRHTASPPLVAKVELLPFQYLQMERVCISFHLLWW